MRILVFLPAGIFLICKETKASLRLPSPPYEQVWIYHSITALPLLC